MPSEQDPRYTGSGPPDPPTLEQLAGMLEASLEVKAYRTKDGSRSRIEFLIDNDRLAANGLSCYATGAQILEGLRDAMARLRYIDECTKTYSDPEKKGATAADCQAFIANELKHVSPTFDLESNMRRRMFNTTLQKLVELGMWRAAIDAERFQNQREAERKRQKRQEEINESIRKQQERMKEAEDRMRRESRAGADKRTENPYEDAFKEDFWSAFGEGVYGSEFREAFRNARHGFAYGGTHREPPKTKARDKGRESWWVVLEIPVTSTREEIEKAYRRLAAKYHPDRNKDPSAAKKMTDINTARDDALKGL